MKIVLAGALTFLAGFAAGAVVLSEIGTDLEQCKSALIHADEAVLMTIAGALDGGDSPLWGAAGRHAADYYLSEDREACVWLSEQE